ncbi:MAG: hypothetical protein ABIT38_11960 [Gemmatimonadaceae bacterium]
MRIQLPLLLAYSALLVGLGLFVDPRMRRAAERLQLQTLGDYLEYRYGTIVRAVVAILMWVGTLAILAGQLIALSTLLTLVADVPVAIGSLGLAALFSAEVSTADAILFMLSTSLSRDLYLRFVNPKADDARVLRVARLRAVAGGALGVFIALMAQKIIGTLSFFYSVLGVGLFVPIVAGSYRASFGRREALAGIGAGLVVMLALQLPTRGAGVAWVTPAIGGLLASLIAATAVHLAQSQPNDKLERFAR